MNPQAHLFERAAEALADDRPLAEADPNILRLIDSLGYRDGEVSLLCHRAALLKAAARLKRLFQLSAPDAPGLVFFGGEATPVLADATNAETAIASFSGAGTSARQAFESCVSEAVEYLSQFDTGRDSWEHGTIEERAAGQDDGTKRLIEAIARDAGVPLDRELAWLASTRLSDGITIYLPVDICVRRARVLQNLTPPFKLGTGCGAGRSRPDAALHGILEQIERDAVSQWWRGGRRGLPISPQSRAGEAARALLLDLRRGQSERLTWLLDITTDIGVPCAAALSCRRDGYGLAVGHAARATMTRAVRAAILEMCQIELAEVLVATKLLEDGAAALTDSDLRHHRRSTLINAEGCALLHPDGAPAANRDGEEQSPEATLQSIVEILASMQIDALAVDLTRADFAIPVVKIVTPGLQPEPSQMTTERLARIIGTAGGGQKHLGDIALL